MYYETLRTRGSQSYEDQIVLFVAGDDVEAKTVILGLVDEIGLAPVDTGSLRDGGGKQ